MPRLGITKIERFSSRHPGLREKVHAMFAEFWPPQAVRQMIQTQYGECLSLRSIARYKQQHWLAQRELGQVTSEAIESSAHRFIEPSGHRLIEPSVHRAIGPSENKDESMIRWKYEPVDRWPEGSAAR